MDYQEVIFRVSKKLNLPEEDVNLLYQDFLAMLQTEFDALIKKADKNDFYYIVEKSRELLETMSIFDFNNLISRTQVLQLAAKKEDRIEVFTNIKSLEDLFYKGINYF